MGSANPVPHGQTVEVESILGSSPVTLPLGSGETSVDISSAFRPVVPWSRARIDIEAYMKAGTLNIADEFPPNRG